MSHLPRNCLGKFQLELKTCHVWSLAVHQYEYFGSQKTQWHCFTCWYGNRSIVSTGTIILLLQPTGGFSGRAASGKALRMDSSRLAVVCSIDLHHLSWATYLPPLAIKWEWMTYQCLKGNCHSRPCGYWGCLQGTQQLRIRRAFSSKGAWESFRFLGLTNCFLRKI